MSAIRVLVALGVVVVLAVATMITRSITRTQQHGQGPGAGDDVARCGRDFLAFRRMLTPVIIQALFWLGVYLWTVLVLRFLAENASAIPGDYRPIYFVAGGLAIAGGILVLRVLCELAILFFRMNETLTDVTSQMATIEEELGKANPGTGVPCSGNP